MALALAPLAALQFLASRPAATAGGDVAPASPPHSAPNFQGCADPSGLAYCNPDLPAKERVRDLLGRLNLTEKIGIISPYITPSGGFFAPIPRLQVPGYRWLTETNTGASSQCWAPERCATTFVGPMGMGASFNTTSWLLKGRVISEELRALRNIGGRRLDPASDEEWVGPTGYGPNINLARDPRYGRTSELPSEDPYHAGSYAAAMVRGAQEEDGNGVPRMLTYLKHYTAYSSEANRGHDTYNISQYDLWDSFLPQYQMGIVQGGSFGVMCSYTGVNGHPMCANDELLGVLRSWDADAHVATDCGVLTNAMGPPLNAATKEEAAAWVLNNGTDLELGTTVWRDSLVSAMAKGLTREQDIDRAVTRTLLQLFRGGLFDPLSWAELGADTLNSTAHQAVSYDAALQSVVLLKNTGILPLDTSKSLAVIGPMANATGSLLSDYAGDQICYQSGPYKPQHAHPNYDCMTRIGASLGEYFGDVTIESGVDIDSFDFARIAGAVQAASRADQVVLAVGIDKSQEKEGHDRTSIGLPGLQPELVKRVLALGKPVVLLLCNGGVLGIDDFIDGSSAIVEAFNPAVLGARALASLLVGRENRWGRLPVTMYPSDYVKQQPMTNYDMSKPPGRGYRYYLGTPLFEFGTGLTYGKTSMQCTASNLTVSCSVRNDGGMPGDEVIMVYHVPSKALEVDHPVPQKKLIAFERVYVPHAGTTPASFPLSLEDFMLITADGSKKLYPGNHTVRLSLGHGEDAVLSMAVGHATI